MARQRRARSRPRPRAAPRRDKLRSAAAERHRFAAEAARVFPWEWDIRADRLDWLHPPEALLGPRPAGGRYPDFRDMVHPEDRALFLEAGQAAMRSLGEYRCEARLVRTDGEVRWFHARGRAYGDAAGRPARMHGATVDVHESRLAREALAASEARFRSLTELSGDWYWEQDADLRFVATAGPMPTRGGITAEEHIGRRRWELPRTRVAGGDWGPHQADLAARRPFRNLLVMRTDLDGAVHYVSVSGAPLFDGDGRFAGYRGLASDVTRELQLEEQTRAVAERMRLLVENLDEPMYMTDPGERFVFGNRRFRELNDMLGRWIEPGTAHADYLRAAVEAGQVVDAIGREADWIAERTAQRRRGGGPYERRRAGERLMLIYDQRFDDGSILTYSVDITERKRVEDALRELNQTLEQRVQERTAELEAFSYSVSHDLRAPLRAIGAFASMLVEEEGAKLPAESARKLAIVERNAVKMGELVDDLLMLARLSRAELRPVPLDLAHLARAVAEELRPQHAATRVSVALLPPARGDETLLRQVLVNLLDNAFKYSSKQPAPRVDVGWRDDARAYFVRDNGVGFDMAHAPKLFRAFERLHTEAEFEGTGIGLAIVKRVVERHGGRVWAEAAPGAGATFCFTLPLVGR